MELLRLSKTTRVTSEQVIHVASRAGLSRDEKDKLERALRGWGRLDAGGGTLPGEGDDEVLPLPVIRLVERYVVDGMIDAGQVERLAVLTGLAGGAAALGAALPVLGVRVRPDGTRSYGGLAADDTGQDQVDPTQKTEEVQPLEETVNGDISTEVVGGQGVYDPADTEKALAAARAVLRDDRYRPKSVERLLNALEEWGLCELLRDGLPLDEDIPVEYVQSLSPDSEAYGAWSALITHNQRLVKSIAFRYRDWETEGLALNDIEHHGVLGLMTAIRKFDVTRRYKFSTYATHWIRQSIERGIANESSLIRYPVHFQKAIRKIRRAERRFWARGERPSHEGLRLETGLPAKTITDYFHLRRHVDHLDRLVGDTTLEMLVGKDRTAVSPDEIIEESLRRERAQGVLSLLSDPRQAQVLRLRHGLGDDQPKTLEQIGEFLGVTRERVRQIEKQAVATIRSLTDDVPLLPGHTPEDALDQIIRSRRVGSGREPATATPAKRTRQAALHRHRKREQLRQQLAAPGQTLSTAMAEVVDFAVRAEADTVRIDYSTVASRTWLAITHDGRGMDEGELSSVMRVSPRTGLTSISLSQAQVVSVLSRGASGRLVAQTWDVGQVDGNGRWYARRDADPEALDILDHLAFEGQGSVVLWRRTEELGAGRLFDRRVRSAVRELGLVFHRPIEERRLRILVGGKPVAPVDPFVLDHPATQNRGVEEFFHEGHRVRIRPVVLPHPSRLPDEKPPPGDAGFYIYRGDRLLAPGGWMGIANLRETRDTSLARVSVELSAEAALLWGLEPGCRTVVLPAPVSRRLAVLAGDVRERSARVFARRRDQHAR